MINKQSNVYTIIYITVMVVVVGAALAFTAMSLKDRQQENADADKMKQILQSVHVATERSTVVDTFSQTVTSQFIVNAQGDTIATGDAAFAVDMAKEKSVAADKRQLPVFVCTLADGSVKYVLPLAGMGLWGPIWGYVAFDEDGSTVYGAYFDHQGETPGLGAEITKPAFTDQFEGKHMFIDGQFIPVTVVKKGQKPAGAGDYVDGISGGTITSKGVAAMLDDCLLPYRAWLDSVRK